MREIIVKNCFFFVVLMDSTLFVHSGPVVETKLCTISPTAQAILTRIDKFIERIDRDERGESADDVSRPDDLPPLEDVPPPDDLPPPEDVPLNDAKVEANVPSDVDAKVLHAFALTGRKQSKTAPQVPSDTDLLGLSEQESFIRIYQGKLQPLWRTGRVRTSGGCIYPREHMLT